MLLVVYRRHMLWEESSVHSKSFSCIVSRDSPWFSLDIPPFLQNVMEGGVCFKLKVEVMVTLQNIWETKTNTTYRNVNNSCNAYEVSSWSGASSNSDLFGSFPEKE